MTVIVRVTVKLTLFVSLVLWLLRGDRPEPETTRLSALAAKPGCEMRRGPAKKSYSRSLSHHPSIVH